MMDRYTVFGIEKPFPWVGVALAAGLLGGGILTALLSWAFATGTLPFLEKIIDDRPSF
ncbi:hypothetical protein I5J47_gp25 [Mycobacterium phage Arib1]|uniref:Uncharacterized protein n=7 Tax=Fishburnevirus TaxID=1983734 RepID=A0A249XTF9_9CAUD|nr:hypothetical protein MALITHI_25 [Mycobacterium phage Malithi]YP_009964280.1 membrane protein [Mycobacterium phage Megiddo]YP_009964673.1 hypothetical protein I5J44_gp25 [Mycobacterium phage Phineas]YP_009964909.1 hypothetical protein I5J47_gp25 [Mycobacterium phage Arib1]YP_009964987.1 hypothetical protein I5J48_gp25 [Mycobacterium phage Majeke]YP_010001326.1 membrane protein [Mycobacterium phage KilKor]AYQ99858.1 hypothetical protein PBI_MANGETHE_25 [Mycobacterium phage Mangethe]QBI97961